METKPILIAILFIVIVVLISGIMSVFENNTPPGEKLVINDLNIAPTQYGHYKLVGHVTPKKDMDYIEARVEYFSNSGVMVDKNSPAWNIRDVKANQELGIERIVSFSGSPDYAVVSFYDDVGGKGLLGTWNITFQK